MEEYTKSQIFNLPLNFTVNTISDELEYFRLGGRAYSQWIASMEIRQVLERGVTVTRTGSYEVIRMGKSIVAHGRPGSWLNPHLYAYFYCYNKEIPIDVDKDIDLALNLNPRSIIPEVNVHAKSVDNYDTKKTINCVFDRLEDIEKKIKPRLQAFMGSMPNTSIDSSIEALFRNL